jgi:iron complex transport system ATP-binding protein
MALEARDLCVSLGGRQVVAGSRLHVAAGRWLCVVGPNGAGKSSLLRALARVRLPGEQVTGSVQVAGHATQLLAPRALAQQRAWMGQHEPCPDDLLARDVVMLGRWPHQGWFGQPGPADHQAVGAALDAMDAVALADRPLGALSGGERQRVLLARALAVEAPLLLLDEPLTHLDAPHQVRLLRALRQHCAAGGTVVTVAHDLPWALQADELLVMAEAHTLHHGPRTDAATHRAVEAAFGHAVRLQAEPGGGQVSVRLNLG